MELQQCVGPADVILCMKARDRWEALRELLDRVFPSRGTEHEKVLAALYDAEGRGCSAVGRSVIVAHAVTGGVSRLKVVFGRAARPIPWNAPDGRMAHLLWLIVHPPSAHDAYLEVLSQTVRLCRSERHRNELAAVRTVRDVLGIISRAGGRVPPR